MQVLVYGAGQLAQMMYLDGAALGIDVQAVDVSNNAVVHPVSKQPLDCTLAQAIERADVLTVEFEHVPEGLLETAEQSGKLYPNKEAILVGADRVREKALLERLSIPNCAHHIVTDLAQLDACVEALGERLIIKASRDGYDGYGQWRLSQKSDLPALKAQLEGLDLVRVPLVVEQMLQFDREVSLIGARNVSGEIKVYPLAENLHYQGQLHVSVAPATNSNDALTAKALEIFSKLVEGMDYVGVLAVELFQCGDTLLVNELAPRVHNSGHWTQAGADTSQFENHLRAVLDLPLGDTANIGGNAAVSAMINIIGCDSHDLALLSLPGVHLNWYGKTVRNKRKMGHINVTAGSYQALGAKLEQLSGYLSAEHFPELIKEASRLQK
ncbi:5-(carboxyamino)imidazole ribonucleotide synthase [Aestuariibacter sp. GS-14]|uniref:5-(carboxyamino)imidazole ribonucleotide synthase n=1 Tax=Aestuariibacter sp. GS-14 TaxID=2590670 RepID=UPI00112A61EE|nr:5-(carboxyamino)imidazole ribonucleotide synthase [Aestuariibacter sp. GS-14]TPV58339.1 5-(carboxyamino)imidazole ribonucleotide synthase [Aestuariibacter sp. GS-14]